MDFLFVALLVVAYLYLCPLLLYAVNGRKYRIGFGEYMRCFRPLAFPKIAMAIAACIPQLIGLFFLVSPALLWNSTYVLAAAFFAVVMLDAIRALRSKGEKL
jgi:hypothetical protein